MKALVKLAVGGIIAMTFATSAFAQQLQLSNAMRTQAGRLYLAQMGINAGTPAAEVSQILGRLSQAELAAVSRTVGAFNAKFVNGNVAANEASANSIFKPNGQLLVVVAANSANINRDGVSTAAGPSCSVRDLAEKLTVGTRVSLADAERAIKFWGARISVGTCNAEAGGLVGYAVSARENFLEAAISGMDKLQRMGDYSQVSLKETWAEALALAKNNDANAVATTPAAERGTVDALHGCQLLRLQN